MRHRLYNFNFSTISAIPEDRDITPEELEHLKQDILASIRRTLDNRGIERYRTEIVVTDPERATNA